MSTADWIQTILLVTTIIGLMVTIRNNRNQLQLLNNQLKLSLFADYTKRYQEIILNLPLNINDDNFSFDTLTGESRDKTLRYMRIYFDLCSEEYDLWLAGYIEDRIWKIWSEGMEFAFSKKSFRDAWVLINIDTVYYPDFSKWVNDILCKIEKEKSNISETAVDKS